MKKWLACMVMVAVLLSVGAVYVWAESGYPADIAVTPGCFAAADSQLFYPVGEVWIHWDETVAERVNMTDGDISDWQALGYFPTIISSENMVSWVGGAEGIRDPGMPAEWGIAAYYVADPNYLYMIYDITDSDFTYGKNASSYDGDALQLSVDFGGLLKKTYEKELTNSHGIFYSFSCTEDGAPLQIIRQESDQDGLLSEANGDGVKGAARKTDKGWSVELALSWEQLYDDCCWKAWLDNPRIYLGGDDGRSLSINMALYYLNRTDDTGYVTWAAGTTKGSLYPNTDTPGLSWSVYDHGVELVLPYEVGMVLNGTDILILDGGCGILPPETQPAQTEPPYDPPVDTELVGEVWTEPGPPIWIEPETEYKYEEDCEVPVETAARDAESANREEPDINRELNDIMAKYGCSAVAGAGTLTAFLILAAAFVLKKKHE